MALKIKVKNDTRQILMGTSLILTTQVRHKSLVVPFKGSKKLKYTWSLDGIPFGSEEGDRSLHDRIRNRKYFDRPVFSISSVRLEDAGMYECTINNAFGEVETTPVFVEVIDVSETSMYGKNLVTNGDFKDGNNGWILLDGSMEAQEPYFHDSKQRNGIYARSSLTPKPSQVAKKNIIPEPEPGDRVMGDFVDRGNGVVKMSQEIDLTPIANVVDREVEGISSVDIKVGSWFLSKEFPTTWGYKCNKTENEAWRWDRGLYSYWDNSNQAQPGGNGSSAYPAGNDQGVPLDIRLFTYLRHSFIQDSVKISYIFENDNQEVIDIITLESIPSSYTRHLNPFRERRKEIPPHTRRIKIVIEYRRDGGRPYDHGASQWHNRYQKVKSIMCGVWGVQARIYVNEERINDINGYNKMWKLPDSLYVHPSFWSIKYKGGTANTTTSSKLAIAAVAEKAKLKFPGNDDRTVKTFMGAGSEEGPGPGYSPYPYLKWYGTGGVMCCNIFKSFDAGVHKVSGTYVDSNLTEDEKVFHIPTFVGDAVRSYLNVKASNLVWFLDKHTKKMERHGVNKLIFKYAYPDHHKDEINVIDVLQKRRTFVMLEHDGVSMPSIKQTIRYEDIDDAIKYIHKNTAGFDIEGSRAGTHPITKIWDFEERDKILWGSDGDTINKLYSWIDRLGKSQFGTQVGGSNWSSVRTFFYNPWDNSDMELMYDNMLKVCEERISLRQEGSGPTDEYGFGSAENNHIIYHHLKLQAVVERLRRNSGIPESIWERDISTINDVVLERLRHYVLLTMIKDWIRTGSTEAQYSKRWRKVVYGNKRLKECISPNNYYTGIR